MPLFTYQNFTFQGISIGGIQTSIKVDPLDISFDIGRCPLDFIRTPTILISHGHLDHSAGIAYHISQRAFKRMTPPVFYLHPKLKKIFEKILKLYAKAEGFEAAYSLIAAVEKKRYQLKGNYFFIAQPSFHRVPSVAYTILESKKKLKAEFQALKADELVKLKEKNIEISENVDTPLISFSGDTKIDYLFGNEIALKSKILFLECTYLDNARTIEKTKWWGHTHFDEIAANAD